MSQKYQINDLVTLLGISRTAVNRKIQKYKFNTVQEYVNGRLLKLIIVSDEQLNALKHEVGITKSVNTVSSQFTTHSLNISQHDNTVVTPPNFTNNEEKLITQVISLSETVQKQSETVQQFVDRVVNAEKKVLLLEDLETRQKTEYLELSAKIKELTEQNEELKKENQELKSKLEKTDKPWWKLK